MSEIGLLAEAIVPRGHIVKLEIGEDVDNDGEFENSKTQKLKDGTYLYVLSGFEGSPRNMYGANLRFERDDSVKLNPARENPEAPGVSSWEVIPIGPSESNEISPRPILEKLQEAKYFIDQMKNGKPESFRYNLGGFLSSMYSIEELIERDWCSWSDWASTEGEEKLHEFLMEKRHQGVHLLKHSRGSVKPPISQSIKWDFGDSAESSVIKQTVNFGGVPLPVMEEFIDEEDRIELADPERSIRDTPVGRIVPVGPLCEMYLSIVENRIGEWLSSLSEEKLEQLNIDIQSG